MNPLLFFGLVLIAGFSNACPGLGGIPPNILDILKEMAEHIGHDHKHGHHHDGIGEVVMEHLGNILVIFDNPFLQSIIMKLTNLYIRQI